MASCSSFSSSFYSVAYCSFMILEAYFWCIHILLLEIYKESEDQTLQLCKGIRKTPTWKIPTTQTPPWWIPTRKIPTWNIPTYFYIFPPGFFSLLSPLSLVLLFCNSMFVGLKSDLLRCIEKFLACRPKWLHIQKSFAGQVW